MTFNESALDFFRGYLIQIPLFRVKVDADFPPAPYLTPFCPPNYMVLNFFPLHLPFGAQLVVLQNLVQPDLSPYLFVVVSLTLFISKRGRRFLDYRFTLSFRVGSVDLTREKILD